MIEKKLDTKGKIPEKLGGYKWIFGKMKMLFNI